MGPAKQTLFNCYLGSGRGLSVGFEQDRIFVVIASAEILITTQLLAAKLLQDFCLVKSGHFQISFTPWYLREMTSTSSSSVILRISQGTHLD